jgi:hypothetical protein
VRSIVCSDWQRKKKMIRDSQRSDKGVAGSVELGC